MPTAVSVAVRIGLPPGPGPGKGSGRPTSAPTQELRSGAAHSASAKAATGARRFFMPAV